MRFLLFFLCAFFSGIFYLFSTFSGNTSLGFGNLHNQSFSGNLSIEAIIFLIAGVFLFFYFSEGKRKKDEGEEKEPIFSLSISEAVSATTSFFQKHLYYIGFILFYIALYLIFSSFGEVSFSYCIFFLNIAIFCLFFLTNRFYILQDFLKINTILFSCVYIILYISVLFGGESIFTGIDFINSLVITGLFIVFLGFENHKQKKAESDPILATYFSLYLLVSGVFYIDIIFSAPIISYCLLSFTLGIILFYIPQHFPYLQNSRKNLRYISLIFLYTSFFAAVITTLLYGLSFIPFVVLVVGMRFHYMIHVTYQNYVSFFFSFFHFFFFFCYFFFQFLYIGEYKDILLIMNFLLLSFMFVIYTYIYPSNSIYDTYSIHIFSYIVNIFGVTLFLILSDFSILALGVILLIESLFVFLSYYKLNTTILGQK